MKRLIIGTLSIVSMIYSACRNTQNIHVDGLHKSAKNSELKKDTSPFYLDSVRIVKCLQFYPINEDYQENLRTFYKKRNYEFAWIDASGINEFATNFMNLLNQEEGRKKDMLEKYYSKLPGLYNRFSEENYKFSSKDSLVTELEFLLTVIFFDYAKRNWKGIGDEDLIKVGWLIQRKTVNYEKMLDTILKRNASTISSFEPVYRQYALLKSYLLTYRNIEKTTRWPTRPGKLIEFKVGDTSNVLVSLKRQLFLLKDLTVKDSTNSFNTALVLAIKNFQKRYGLPDDGTLNAGTIIALDVSLHELIEKILINMERCRWVPIEQKGDYLLVNIPAFKLYVYNNDSLEWTCNAIVGKSKLTSNTVIFNDSMDYVVFSPYWNVPQSIILREILPGIKKNGSYLLNHNMEVVNTKEQVISQSSLNWQEYTRHFPYKIRQKPGKDNALGLVKFLFPNSYDIYMHDTPAKSLFGETTRLFSHGCIRLEEPSKLAQFLLRDDPTWTDNSIKIAMNGGKQIFVKLKRKVPVFIAYFTTWVDRVGKLNVREDVYGHDAKMKTLLFAN